MSVTISLNIIPKIADVSRTAWDNCATAVALAEPQRHERFNPFTSYDFLHTLEISGSVGGRSGWQPAHVLAKNADGAIIGATPAYLKTHSMGEYVFDHAWADALQRAGGRYYPKVLSAVPFTPVTGPRLLAGGATARSALLQGLEALRRESKSSSVHVNFIGDADRAALADAGFLARQGQQFHFQNQEFGDFATYLGALAARKRKMVRHERAAALAPGIEIFDLTGSDIKTEHWDAFYEFYLDTGSRKWGQPYLTRSFFEAVGASMAQHILLVMARRNGRWIAGALNFIGADALYGRNWGAIEHHPFLHFELCYYRAIEFAITRGLKRVEAGAQGEHKLARGYGPVATYSAHHFADPRMMAALGDYLARETQSVEADMELYEAHMPFRHDSPA